jgi:hypothetical protein
MSDDASKLGWSILRPAAMACSADGVEGNGDLTEPAPTADLDARQDEVLRLLDELNARIEAAIQVATGLAPAATPSTVAA